MLKRIFFRLFWNTYDNLGGWLLCSAAAFFISIPIITIPLAWGGLLAVAARADRQQDVTLGEWWAGLRRYAGRSYAFTFILLLGCLLILGNIWFYAASDVTQNWGPVPKMMLTSAFFWIGVFFFIGLMIGWAFMALQDLTVRKALKRGFLVMAAHPLSAFITFLLMLFMGFPLAGTGLGLVLLFGAVMANLIMGFAAGAVDYYEEIEDAKLREKIEREGARDWATIRALEAREEARRHRYDRGLRDILRPWDMQ